MEEIVVEIIKVLQDNSLEAFVTAIIKRLEGIGCEPKPEDAWLIAFCVQKVRQHLINICNVAELPDGLFYTAVDRVCGEFLYSLNQSGGLKLDNLDLDGAITQIHEGDTTVQFAAGAGDAEKFAALVDYWRNEGDGDFVCYRRLKW